MLCCTVTGCCVRIICARSSLPQVLQISDLCTTAHGQPSTRLHCQSWQFKHSWHLKQHQTSPSRHAYLLSCPNSHPVQNTTQEIKLASLSGQKVIRQSFNTCQSTPPAELARSCKSNVIARRHNTCTPAARKIRTSHMITLPLHTNLSKTPLSGLHTGKFCV